MVRVHVAPTATAKGELEVYRAPPLREAPSEQARLHVFPVAHLSTEKVIIEEIGGNDGGGGGDGGGDGGDGGDGGEGGGGGSDGGDGGGGGGGGGANMQMHW